MEAPDVVDDIVTDIGLEKFPGAGVKAGFATGTGPGAVGESCAWGTICLAIVGVDQ